MIQLIVFSISLLFISPITVPMVPTQLKSTMHSANLTIKTEKIGVRDAKEVFKYTLENGSMRVEMTNFGGILSRIVVPDKNGKSENVVLALEDISDYFTKNGPSLGAAVGRYANRISNASFPLDGKTIEVTKNIPPNHIHGGTIGFSKKVWDANTFSNAEEVGVKMHYISADGEEGFPGTLDTWLTMSLTTDNKLIVKFESTTDKKTIVNLTNHSYFNLNGIVGDVREHQLKIFADSYTPTDVAQITTGEVVEVKNTPFDFRSAKNLGEKIDELGRGFDENFVTKTKNSPDLIQIAWVKDPESGRTMNVFSTAPGVQLYTANGINDFAGADGKIYQPFWAFCLEPQAWPDSPNRPNFPSASLSPGEKYIHEIVYEFGVDN